MSFLFEVPIRYLPSPLDLTNYRDIFALDRFGWALLNSAPDHIRPDHGRRKRLVPPLPPVRDLLRHFECRTGPAVP